MPVWMMTFKGAITAPSKTICRDISASERVVSQSNAILPREPFPSLALFGPEAMSGLSLQYAG